MLEKTIPWDAEPHVWDDIADDAMRTIYKAYERPLGIGARPAVLAIDLYKMVFAGDPVPPEQQQDRYPSSCGIYAHNAIEPIAALFDTARWRANDLGNQLAAGGNCVVAPHSCVLLADGNAPISVRSGFSLKT